MAKKTRFSPDQFAPTKVSSAKDKARFANQYVKFVGSGFDKAKFPKWFYWRLRRTFSHIAHTDLDGFYETHFSSTDRQVYFIGKALEYPRHGQPAYTYCDVEKALQDWLRQNGIFEKLQRKMGIEEEQRELTIMNHLLDKYYDDQVPDLIQGYRK